MSVSFASEAGIERSCLIHERKPLMLFHALPVLLHAMPQWDKASQNVIPRPSCPPVRIVAQQAFRDSLHHRAACGILAATGLCWASWGSCSSVASSSSVACCRSRTPGGRRHTFFRCTAHRAPLCATAGTPRRSCTGVHGHRPSIHPEGGTPAKTGHPTDRCTSTSAASTCRRRRDRSASGSRHIACPAVVA